MKYPDFKEALKHKVVFNQFDIRKIEPQFHRRRLVDWQKAGYITKIRQGYYVFNDRVKNESILYYMANQIYKPSYISLTSAMSYYGLIPEAIFGVTSVSPLKTTSFETPYGRCDYQNLKPSLFFGYQMKKAGDFNIKIAEPEKMILDYCYFNKPTGTEDFESLRLNMKELKKLIDMEKFNAYFSNWESPVMAERVHHFKTFLHV